MLVLVSVDGLATHIGYNQDNDDQATQACLNIVANAHVILRSGNPLLAICRSAVFIFLLLFAFEPADDDNQGG